MTEVKAALFDADGVVITPQKLFSHQYAQKYGLDPERFEEFFKGDFDQAVMGNADLKDLIVKNHNIWQWDGDPQEILDMWFEAENHCDQEVLQAIKQLRAGGVAVYMATHQEKYRLKYIQETMLPDVFDGFFVSSEIGYKKGQLEFWQAVIQKLRADIPGTKPSEVVFFDDRQESIDGAEMVGIKAILYEDSQQVKDIVGRG